MSLLPFVFSSTQHFRDYWDHHDELHLASNQPLIVQTIPHFNVERKNWPERKTDLAAYLLGQMILLRGQTIKLYTFVDQGPNVECMVGEDFILGAKR